MCGAFAGRVCVSTHMGCQTHAYTAAYSLSAGLALPFALALAFGAVVYGFKKPLADLARAAYHACA